MKLLWQSLLLALCFVFVYVWTNSPLSDYTIPAFGFFIFIFILLSAKKKSLTPIRSIGDSENWIVAIIVVTILLFIFTTGGINSSLFFLLYFLLFGITFALEPGAVFVFLVGIILIFLNDALKNDVYGNLLKLGSLTLLSPIAFFFGKQYKRDEKQTEKIEKLEESTQDAANTIAEDVEEIIEKDKKALKPEDVEKLNDILEETETLREKTKE
ncbi:MAG: hypothetical protein M1524_03720 [Patescibacteria group bacterium]|nr:hypothetical protein [Patescibacteria group bacterium]